MKRCMDNIVRMLDGQPTPGPQRQPNRPLIEDDGKPFTDESLMPFGKHAGTKLKFLPQDYLNWMMEQPEMKNVRLNNWLKAKKRGGKTMAQEIVEPPNEFLADKQINEALERAKEEGVI